MKTNTRNLDQEISALMKMRDEEIDTSDIPEIKDWSKAVVGKFYRPKKEPVTIRLDVDIVAWLKADGPGYQTRINALLREVMTPVPTLACNDEEGATSPGETVGPVPQFHFPNLERQHELAKYGRVAAVIAERGCVFAPAA